MDDKFDDFDSDGELPNDLIEWLETCERILENCEDVSECAEDFAVSVSEKIESMSEWIRKNKRITPKMIEAIENMDEALQQTRN